MADALGAGFGQSVHMVADELGFDLDPELRTTHEMAVATAPIESPIGPIAPGLVAAQRFRWEGLVDGEPVVTAAVNWLMGEEHLDPPWRFGPDGEHFEVEITGDPDCLVTFRKLHPASVEAGLARNPGIVATAMHCVNAVPYVCEAEPGLRTYLEMPLVAGRAARTCLTVGEPQSAELTASSSPRGCADASSGRRRNDLLGDGRRHPADVGLVHVHPGRHDLVDPVEHVPTQPQLQRRQLRLQVLHRPRPDDRARHARVREHEAEGQLNAATAPPRPPACRAGRPPRAWPGWRGAPCCSGRA